MAGHITADAATAGPAPAIHAGVNQQICKFSLGGIGTPSGSTSVFLTPLPAGAEVTEILHALSNDGLGTGGETLSIYATIGGYQLTPGSAQYSYVVSSNAASTPVTRLSHGVDVGKRITASANLWARYHNLVGTGTSTVDVTVVVNYLTQKRGD